MYLTNIMLKKTRPNMSQFTWLPFFEEMLDVICRRYSKDSLSKVFHKVFAKSGGISTKFPDGRKEPHKEIDPLTFIGSFNKQITDKNRIHFCQLAKESMELQSDVPTDFDSIPRLNNMNVWFFSHSETREKNAIERLWNFSRELNTLNISGDSFNGVLNIKRVGLPKLTTLMFICKPKQFISLDNTNVDYFIAKKFCADRKIRAQVEKDNKPYDRYRSVVADIKEYFKGKAFYEISQEAYEFREGKAPEKKADGNRYWVIAPGEHARLWEDFKNNSIIAIGWDELGNLDRFSSKQQIRKELGKIYSEGRRTNDALACYQFRKEIGRGDYVLAKKGVSEIVGYGKVVSDYIYDNNRHEYHHTRKVEWLSSGVWKIPQSAIIGIRAIQLYSGKLTKG